MIFVRWRDAELKAVWNEAAATQHRRAVAACESAEKRSEYFDAHAQWRTLRPLFERWSYGKCWYTEARTTHAGGTFEVDHFRPKSAARDPWNRLAWDGYPWLAYDPANFRLAARTANTAGRDVDGHVARKGTLFPLLRADAPIATCCDEIEREREFVCIVDPLDRDAVDDVSFNETGKVTCVCIDDERRHRRVQRTVSVYDLDHAGLIEARLDVWRRCLDIVDEVAKLQRWTNDPALSPDNAREMREAIAKKRAALRAMVRSDAEFAGTARAFCRTRVEPWVRVVGQSSDVPEEEAFESFLRGMPSNEVEAAPVAPREYEWGAQLGFAFVHEAEPKGDPPPSKKSERARGKRATPAKKPRAKRA